MKKFLLSLVVCLFAVSASAQIWQDVETAFTTKTKWAVGGRIGSGLEAQAEYTFDSDNYIEGRFGMGWICGGLTADFTALYQWQIFDMDWTPSAGKWFFDAGAGVGVGGCANYCYVGAAGSAKLGIKFKNAPVKLAFDWTPIFGAEIAYFPKVNEADTDSVNVKSTYSKFFGRGLINFGISCVYCF